MAFLSLQSSVVLTSFFFSRCLQHPYLVSRELEPTGAELTPESIHKNLVDASTKLKLLHNMLPKLKARGHRVLLFSQVSMTNIISKTTITVRESVHYGIGYH